MIKVVDYRCRSHDRKKHQEVVAWVRENVKNGFNIVPAKYGYIEGIYLDKEEDYLLYLLRWSR